MRASTVFAIAAAGLASAAEPSTLTVVSTLTQTKTLTSCKAGYTGCPVKHTSSSVPHNTTTVVPTSSAKWNVTNSTTTYCPTASWTSSVPVVITPTASIPAQPPAVKPSSGAVAGANLAKSGLVGAALAAVMAIAF